MCSETTKLRYNQQKELLNSSQNYIKKCGKMKNIPEELKCVVTTRDGPICGYKDVTDSVTYYKFKSIPYALPPLGQYRFLPPMPITPWTELKDCTQDAPVPIQYYFNIEVIGSEDCLYMEVTTPNVQPNKPLPVMFWIGAYCFTFNMDQICDPYLLIGQEVVFVRCGFRLGPFGFLSINDLAAPGNSGLKDIVMALIWVQKNIQAFGGDPTNVTIFGDSAGGAIVHLMMLSPMASSLFHKAIIQSASALNSWSLSKNPTQPVLELAKILNIKSTCNADIVNRLRSLPAEEIMAAFTKMQNELIGLQEKLILDTHFKPSIEEEFEGHTAFLTRWPLKIFKSGTFNKVPLLIGSNNIEADILQFINEDFYKDFEKYNKNLNLLVPRALSGETAMSNNVGQQLLKFYLSGEEHLSENSKSQYLQLVTDYYFLYYVNKTVQLHSQFAPECPVYYYIVDFAGQWVLPDFFDWFNSMSHSAEIPLIFGLKLPHLCSGSQDSLITRNRVVKMWTNFAKYGNPTPEDDPLLGTKWLPVGNENELNCLNIGAELTIGRNPFRDRMAFWDALHKEHTFIRTFTYFNDLGITW